MGVTPKLATLRIGNRADDIAYERAIIKVCRSLNVGTQTCALPGSASEEEMLKKIEELGRDDSVHGILPFRPMPGQISISSLKSALPPAKDVDCIGPAGSAAVFDRSLAGFLPCTAEAVMETMFHYNVPLEGANAVVIGRSMVVGRALALLLLDANCTVTVCHSRTRDIPSIAGGADLLICAIGRAKMIDARYVKAGAVVVDVGINDDGQGGICGDADFESISGVAGAATPVPRGIGAVTSTLIVRNTVRACKRMIG
jgi:methylenetetrahydrofolate dehydrogenase (NADP+)/methenyltetrahydrofolate cyclohydrolase